MKLSSTIIFVPLTAALPVYTTDQLNAIIAHPNPGNPAARDAEIIAQSSTYKRDKIPSAKISGDIQTINDNPTAPQPTDPSNWPTPSRIKSMKAARGLSVAVPGLPITRETAATVDRNGIVPLVQGAGVAAVDGVVAANMQYPGAAKIEERGDESPEDLVKSKWGTGKRIKRFLRKRVETNPFCPLMR